MLRSASAKLRPTWGRRSAASFVGTLCQGKINPTELFPFPTSSLPQHVKDSMIESRTSFTKEGSADTWGLMIPDHFGGLGLPHPCVFDVISHADASRYAHQHFHNVGAFLIRSFANKEHQGRYLAPMSDGSSRVGWAVDEFESPNDPCGAAAGKFLEDRASYEVTGRKAVCDVTDPTGFVVMLRLQRGDTNALGWIYVDAKAPGVKYAGNVLTFDKAVVPMDNVFVGARDGYRTGMTSTLTAQYMAAAALVSAARAAAKMAGGNATPYQIALLQTHAYAVESVGSALAANIEKGVSDTFLEAASLALLNGRLLEVLRSVDPVSPAVERLLSQTAPLARAAACCGVEDFAQIFNATSTLETMQQRTLRMGGFVDRFPELQVDAAIVKRAEGLVVKFGEMVEKMAVRQGLHAVHKHIELERIAQGLASLYSASAVLSRAHRAVAAKLPSAAVEHAVAAVWAETELDAVQRLVTLNAAATADSAHARIAADLLAE